MTSITETNSLPLTHNPGMGLMAINTAEFGLLHMKSVLSDTILIAMT